MLPLNPVVSIPGDINLSNVRCFTQWTTSQDPLFDRLIQHQGTSLHLETPLRRRSTEIQPPARLRSSQRGRKLSSTGEKVRETRKRHQARRSRDGDVR